MKVAIIIPRIDQLGPVMVIQTLVNSLSKVDELKIKVFYLDKNVDSEINMKVPVERLNPWTFPFSEYDIIHSNGIRPDLFAFLNRKKIKYHISTIHNFVFDDLSFTYNRLISLIFGNIWLILRRRANKLVCVTNTMKNYYSKWFSLTKLEVIFNGIAESENSFILDNEVIETIERFRLIGLTVIGTTGILTKRKGIDQILYLVSKKKGLGLVIIGWGEELFNLKLLAKKLDVTDRCLFCGFRNKAVHYFKYFDFFVMPSRSEGFGLALVEAVQQKVPVICSDIEVFKELFNCDEVTFFKLENRNSLINALKVAMESGNLKADKAYIRYLNNYTGSQMAKSYYNLYQLA